MNTTSWQQVKELFYAALELAPPERAAFLSANCANDVLRHEVSALLAAHEGAGLFLQSPALADAGLIGDVEPENARSSIIGERIGNYEIIRELGRGGMGAVYLAVRSDDAYRKEVAIKLIKRGMDTDLVVRRFVVERQILANLDHPNIARLLDGGMTGDGLPYFVMEYIEGLPITRYCDEHELDTAERLHLFRQVCSAVQLAHQNLVVHRDIKPSNIIVTEEGTPKLLDFGIAKLLSSDRSSTVDATATIGRLLTPEYASPEQLRGLPVTTPSDVYSLGVVLYEMLSGHRPFQFQSRSPEEIIKAVCETDPPKPSEVASVQWPAVSRRFVGADALKTGRDKGQTVSPKSKVQNPKSLRGDLDNILLKALRKEPERRYASVQEFSEDIRRHLAGLPVLAREDTFAYRAGKFAQRHKAGVLAASLIVVSLLVGIAATGWQAHRANVERARAELRFNQVRKLARAVLFDYHDAIEKLPGSTSVREKMVKDSLEYLDNLSAESSNDPSLQRELAAAYEKVGHVQGNPYSSNLGDAAGALNSYRKALEIREVLAAANPNDAAIQRELAYGNRNIADMLWAKGDSAGALDNYRKALGVEEKLYAADPAQAKNKMELSAIHYLVGQALKAKGDVNEALESFRRALQLNEEGLALEPDNQRHRHSSATASLKIGDCMYDLGNYTEALAHHRKAFEIMQSVAATNRDDSRLQRTLAFFHGRVAMDQKRLGDVNRAVENESKGVEILKGLVDADPNDEQRRFGLGYLQSELSDSLGRQNKITEALESGRKAITLLSASVAKNADYTEARLQLALTHKYLGNALLKSGHAREAMENYRKALPILEAEPIRDGNLSALARLYMDLGDAETKLASETKASEHWREAKRWYQRSLDVWKDLQQRGPLKPDETKLPDEIGGKISQCEAALVKAAGDK